MVRAHGWCAVGTGSQKVTQTVSTGPEPRCPPHGLSLPQPFPEPSVASGSPITVCSALDLAAEGPGQLLPALSRGSGHADMDRLVGRVEAAGPFHVFSVFCRALATEAGLGGALLLLRGGSWTC